MNLITVDEAAKQTGMEVSKIEIVIKSEKLKPSLVTIGDVTLKLYPQDSVFALVKAQAEREDQNRKAAEMAAAEAERMREPTLREVAASVRAIAEDSCEVGGLKKEVEKLHEANKYLWKSLVDQNSVVNDNLSALRSIIVGLRDDINHMKSMFGKELDRSFEKSPVAVIGVNKLHYGSLHARFGKTLDLKVLDARDLVGIRGLSGKYSVYAMRKAVDAKNSALFKDLGITPTIVDGTLDDLINTLCKIPQARTA